MNALEALAISRKYTDEMVEGAGAIKGKNCTISDISPVEGGNNITFSWYLDDGTEQTETLFVANGEDGYDGQDGQDGVTPSILATATVDNNEGTPNVEVVKTGTDANPSFAFNFHNIMGEVGPQGIAGEDGSIWWNTTAAYTEPNYAFNISDLTGPSTKDIALYDYILQTRNNHTVVYVITAINDTTVNTIRFCELTGATGQDGVSPTVTTSEITGGHRITITDAEHPSGQSIDLFNGSDGVDGQDGEDGLPGKNGNIFWITTSDYSTPNYTFNISDLSGVSGMEPSPDDIIIQNVEHRTFLYVIDDVTISTVRADYFCEITGATGSTGATGNGISSVVLNQDYTLTINYTDGTSTTTTSIRGAQGPSGQNGTDGISPTITITDYTGYHHVEIVSAGGTESFDIYDGTDGQDGVSPTVTVRQITGGHQIEIVAASSTERFDVMDGSDGQDGSDGNDGSDGVSPTVTISSITGGHRVNITDATHPSGQNFDVMDGATGSQGETGPTGPAGPGIATGGSAGQILAKASGTDYDTEWIDAPSGGGDSGIDLTKHIPISNTLVSKTWSGVTIDGRFVWTDGDNIYFSNGENQYVLDKKTLTWSAKTWYGLTNFYANRIWTDGDNIYYSNGGASQQYVLNKETSTWSAKTWSGLTSFYGYNVWTDGDNIYYSGDGNYVLNQETSTWSTKTWNGSVDFSTFSGSYIWTDGDNIYYSTSTEQYVLNKETSTWTAKTWTGLTSFSGSNVWTDGENIYYSSSSNQYVLDKETSTWLTKTWYGFSSISGQFVWTDGDNIYFNNSSNSYKFNRKIIAKAKLSLF